MCFYYLVQAYIDDLLDVTQSCEASSPVIFVGLIKRKLRAGKLWETQMYSSWIKVQSTFV